LYHRRPKCPAPEQVSVIRDIAQTVIPTQIVIPAQAGIQR
jgi:hypothetical protein